MEDNTTALCRNLASRGGTLKVFISAGEPSGDLFAARIMAEMSRLAHPCHIAFTGIGGPEMRRQGLQVVVPMEDLRVMGIAELIPHLHRLWSRLRAATAAAVALQPHAVVTVDYKGFNLRLQGRVREGCSGSEGAAPSVPRSVHVVAPSAWAWRGGQRRLKGLRGVIDETLCILPFEPPILEAAGLQATFIGHPVLDELMWDAQSASWEVPRTAETEAARAAALAEIAKEVAARTGRRTGDPSAAVAPAVRRREGFLGESAEASCAGEMGSNPPQEGDVARNQSADSAGPSGRPWPVVCVLPGSRPQEIRRLLPLFGDALGLLSEDNRFRGIAAAIPTLPSLLPAVAAAAARWPVPAAVLDAASPAVRYGMFSACDAALACSGTVTAQLAVAGLPAIVSYRTSAVTEWVAQRLALVPHVSLPNLVLGREAVLEEVFHRATPERLAARLGALLTDEAQRTQQRAALREFTQRLCCAAAPAAGGRSGVGGTAMPPRGAAAAAAVRILQGIVGAKTPRRS